MKPRLESAPYTYEDWDIMRKASRRWMFGKHPGHGIAHIYVPADRRDADIMLAMREWGFVRRITTGLTIFCLPDRLDEWWYWTRNGRVTGERP